MGLVGNIVFYKTIWFPMPDFDHYTGFTLDEYSCLIFHLVKFKVDNLIRVISVSTPSVIFYAVTTKCILLLHCIAHLYLINRISV